LTLSIDREECCRGDKSDDWFLLLDAAKTKPTQLANGRRAARDMPSKKEMPFARSDAFCAVLLLNDNRLERHGSAQTDTARADY